MGEAWLRGLVAICYIYIYSTISIYKKEGAAWLGVCVVCVCVCFTGCGNGRGVVPPLHLVFRHSSGSPQNRVSLSTYMDPPGGST